MDSTKTSIRTFSRRSLLADSLALGAVSVLPSPILGKEAEEKHFSETDVLVVGTGLAGLTAAISAAENGARVLLIEQNAYAGGNTLLSSGFFNAAPAPVSTLGIEQHFKETFEAGNYLGKPELIHLLCAQAPILFDWLQHLGVRFQAGIKHAYGSASTRSHQTVSGSGAEYIETLLSHAQRLGIPVLLDTALEEILRSPSTTGTSGRIWGCHLRQEGISSTVRIKKALVLATGGFAANKTMCSLLDPRLDSLKSSSGATSQGSAMLIAERLGAQLTDMDCIQCCPTSVSPNLTEVDLHLLADDFIWLNRYGERFISEDAPSSSVLDMFLRQPGKSAYTVIDAAGAARLDPKALHSLGQGLRDGTIIEASGLEELAEKLDLPTETMLRTIIDFNKSVSSGTNDAFGRISLGNPISIAPFYACKTGMSIHSTNGGIEIDEKSRAIDFNGQPIAGLYAAGDVCGGIHGTNCLTGNGLALSAVFGRIAGREAASFGSGS